MIKDNAEYQANIRKEIFSEQIKLLHYNLLVSIPANLVCAAVVFIGLSQTGNNKFILSWFTAVIAISVLRIIAFYFYYRSPKNPSFHLSIFLIGMLLSAMLWGMMGSYFMPENNLSQQMIVIIIIAGVTAGGLQTLNANLTASLMYIVIVIFPLCVWLFSQNGLSYLVIGIAMTTYLFFTLTTSMRGYKLLKQTLTLHYENLSLIDNLSVSNKKLFHSYQLLEQHEHEISLINKMNELLQTCQRMSEAYPIIQLTAKELFGQLNGVLALLKDASDHLEIVTQWGNTDIIKSEFDIADCWALRKGHSYLVNDLSKDLPCYHFKKLPTAYVCLPLIVQSGIIGLLILHAEKKEVFSEYQSELATSFCEVIQLSLTNIRLRESLYEQAIHDPLTGLFNRRYLDETLTRELQRIMRDGKTLCVAMLDLDHFKMFNDTHGHEAGDEVLRFIGHLLKENFRESDIACRFGGEEFLVVLVDSDLYMSALRLTHIREEVKKGEVFFQNQLLPPITVSIGIAEAPAQGITAKEIIRAADEALYSAKQGGRDRIEYISYVNLDPGKL